MLIMRSLFSSACAKPKNERSFQYQRQVIRTIRIGSQETVGTINTVYFMVYTGSSDMLSKDSTTFP
uniref:Uncharacterized protein n=1 Tax=Glossina pallidipes TaxID=7398 RepID=A0A1A9ZE19_GLOPL